MWKSQLFVAFWMDVRCAIDQLLITIVPWGRVCEHIYFVRSDRGHINPSDTIEFHMRVHSW